jgi:hypothetical protein
MLRIIYDAVYDTLATVDISGGVLLAAIWFQTGYVALFRAIHGDEAGRAPAPATAPAPRTAKGALPRSPWGVG